MTDKDFDALANMADRAVDALSGERTDDATAALALASAVVARRMLADRPHDEARRYMRDLIERMIATSGVNEGSTENGVTVH